MKLAAPERSAVSAPLVSPVVKHYTYTIDFEHIYKVNFKFIWKQ